MKVIAIAQTYAEACQQPAPVPAQGMKVIAIAQTGAGVGDSRDLLRT